MTEETTELSNPTSPGGIISAIAWAIETVADEGIHFIVMGGGVAMALMQIPIPDWYAAMMGLIVADLLKKKFKSEE